ncbi:hypothetical protein [Leptospira perolatii]|nr:hypothetical protein [Leptospira perolatii]
MRTVEKYGLLVACILPAFGFLGCFSVEFVVDHAYREELVYSHKSSWEEIEILKEAPKRKPYEVFGRVIIRNFGDGKLTKYYYDQIKKELYDRGMDGMFLSGTGVISISPIIFQTGTPEGYTTNVAEIGKQAKVIEGIGFRYKM